MDEQQKTNCAKQRPVVAVIGASSASEAVLEKARQVGRAIRSQGWHLITGGGGGVMEAACSGFREAAGDGGEIAIGILPSSEASFANPFVDIAIPTGMGIARNAIIARSAWGLIAVGGCSGTLSEIALAWQMGRPIASIADSGGWAQKVAGQAIDSRRNDRIFAANTALESIEFIKSSISKYGQ